MGEVGCLVGQAELRVPRLEGSVLLVDISGVAKIYMGDWMFWIERNYWRISWCFRSLYIADIFWNIIQVSLVSLCEACVLLKLDTFNNPERDFFSGLHTHSPFYSPVWLLSRNTSWRTFIRCCYHHTSTWRTWQCSATALKHHNSQRVGYGHPQSWLTQLPMTPRLH